MDLRPVEASTNEANNSAGVRSGFSAGRGRSGVSARRRTGHSCAARLRSRTTSIDVSTTSSVAVKIVTEAMHAHRRRRLPTLRPTPTGPPETATDADAPAGRQRRDPRTDPGILGAMTHPADCEWAAFTEHAPWIVDRDQTTWLQRRGTAPRRRQGRGAAAHPADHGSRPAAG